MLARILGGLRDLVFPKRCHACRTSIESSHSIDDLICLHCWDKIKVNLPPFCLQCGRHLEAKDFKRNVCPDCIRNRWHFDRAFSPCQYDGILKDLIHEFKYKGKDYLGKCLSKLMIDFIIEYDLPIKDMDLVVPVPLHRRRLRGREYNQSEILSNFIGASFQKKVHTGNLNRRFATKPQTELEKTERLTNVRNSFFVAQETEFKKKNILLVDDVLTTGATCSEAASALKNAGAGIVFVLTLAN